MCLDWNNIAQNLISILFIERATSIVCTCALLIIEISTFKNEEHIMRTIVGQVKDFSIRSDSENLAPGGVKMGQDLPWIKRLSWDLDPNLT